MSHTIDIVDLLCRQGPLANGELARLLGISPSTVSSALGALAARNMLRRDPSSSYSKEPGGSERRKRTLRPSPEYGFALTLEMDFDFLLLSAVSFDLRVLWSRRVPVRNNEKQALVDVMEAEIDRALRGSGEGRCLGLGFSLPGHVDAERLLYLHNTRLKGWKDVSFASFRRFHENVVIENLANAKAVGDRMAGAARMVDDFLFVNVANGTGMGIYIHGRLYRGHRFAAGEAGHIIVSEDGSHVCTCGNRGCLESFVSNRAVHAELERLRSSEVESSLFLDPDFGRVECTYDLLARHLEEGDKTAYLEVGRIAHNLGLACANFLHLFSPQRIIIGGSVCALGESFLELLVQEVRRYHLPWQGQIDIRFPLDNAHAGATGMAWLVFERHLRAAA